jgi:hypothetical protein
MSLKPGATLAQVQAVLLQHGIQATAMHPGVKDAALAAWFVLGTSDAAALAAAVKQLQVHPAVDAAYEKPVGEAPA